MSNRDDGVMVVRGSRPGATRCRLGRVYVDSPTLGPRAKKDMAREIAAWVREGAHVQRVPVQQARDMLAASASEGRQ